jgi:hypothetical protein
MKLFTSLTSTLVLVVGLSTQVLAQQSALQNASSDDDTAQSVVVDGTTTLFTSGTGFGMCDGSPSGYFCVQQIKQQAEDQAQNQALIQCQLQRGQLEQFSGICNDFCSPFNIPPGSRMQSVNCNANCTYRCDIPDHPMDIQE